MENHGTDHDKYLITDGKVYLLGGRNTYNYFLGDFSGRKNYDRDMIVFCENPGKDNSVCKLQKYFEAMWNSKECRFFHEKEKLQERRSVKKAVENLKACYTEYNEKNYRWIEDDDYRKDTFETENVDAFVQSHPYPGERIGGLVSTGRIDEKSEGTSGDSYAVYYL